MLKYILIMVLLATSFLFASDYPTVIFSAKMENGNYGLFTAVYKNNDYQIIPVKGLEICESGTPDYKDGVFAFTANLQGKYDIYITENNGKAKNLTKSFSGNFSHPAIINSSKIAVCRNDKGKNEIVIINIQENKLLEPVSEFVNSGQPHAYNQKVVFTGIADGSPFYNGRTDIYMLEGEKITRLTENNIMVCENNPFLTDNKVYFSATSGHYQNGTFVAEKAEIFILDLINNSVNNVPAEGLFLSKPQMINQNLFYIVMNHQMKRDLFLKTNDKTIQVTDIGSVSSYVVIKEETKTKLETIKFFNK